MAISSSLFGGSQAPRRPPMGGGLAAPSGVGASGDDMMASQAASQAAADKLRRGQQAELNAAEDRNRGIQQERDMAAANRQNAVNMGGTESGEYGYAYPSGGGSAGRGMAIGGGMYKAPTPTPAPQPQPTDAGAAFSSLRSQIAPSAVPGVGPGGNSAADQAFARAKDKTGLLALQRLAGVRGEFAGRGLLGGGANAGAIDAVLGDASSGLQNFALGQAQTEADRAYQMDDRNYAGALQQRGQDISMAPSLLALLRASGAVY